MKFLRAVVPHITIAFSLVFLTYLILDMFVNSAMGFINSDVFKWMCMINCVLTIISGCFLSARNRRAARKKACREKRM